MEYLHTTYRQQKDDVTIVSNPACSECPVIKQDERAWRATGSEMALTDYLSHAKASWQCEGVSIDSSADFAIKCLRFATTGVERS